MFAVMFEVNPKPEQWDSYLGYARLLRPELERIDGFLDNERFSSLHRQGWLLSLSIWRDEEAVIRWRTSARHHEIQQKGRFEVFRDYHLRVGEIIADNQLPADQSLREQRFDETAAAAKLVALTERGSGWPAARAGRDHRRGSVWSTRPDGGAGARRPGGVREHLSAGEIHFARLLARCGSRGGIAGSYCRQYPSPAYSGDPRLRHVRPHGSAAILPGRSDSRSAELSTALVTSSSSPLVSEARVRAILAAKLGKRDQAATPQHRRGEQECRGMSRSDWA